MEQLALQLISLGDESTSMVWSPCTCSISLFRLRVLVIVQVLIKYFVLNIKKIKQKLDQTRKCNQNKFRSTTMARDVSWDIFEVLPEKKFSIFKKFTDIHFDGNRYKYSLIQNLLLEKHILVVLQKNSVHDFSIMVWAVLRQKFA